MAYLGNELDIESFGVNLGQVGLNDTCHSIKILLFEIFQAGLNADYSKSHSFTVTELCVVVKARLALKTIVLCGSNKDDRIKNKYIRGTGTA